MPASPVKVGTKAQVFHGTALRTSGGLKKEDLMQNKNGRIVSKKAHAAGLVAVKRLRNAGFVAKKGEFKLFSKKGASPKAASVKAASVKATVKRTMKTRAMKKANHNKRHNASVRAWVKRHNTKKAAVVGGRKSSRKAGRR
jgi:DVNP family